MAQPVKPWYQRLLSVLRPKAAAQGTVTVSQDNPELARWLGAPSGTGVPVNEDSVVKLSAAWACIRLLTEINGSIPWSLHRKTGGDNSEKADDHWLQDILLASPNREMTSVEFRETIAANLCGSGNSYSLIERLGNRISSLYPVRSSCIEVKQKRHSNTRLAGPDGMVFFRYNDRGRYEDLPREKVWHVKGWGWDGIEGLSPIGAAREAMGIALAQDQFGAAFFRQGGVPAGIVSVAQWLTPDQRAKARVNLQEAIGGLGNMHKFALFEGGMKPEPWEGMPLKDMEFILGRKFSAEEICRFYRVPPHMVALLDRATFNNIEHLSLDFVTFTLMPYFTRFEASVQKWLLPLSDRGKYFLRFNVEGLLRGDSKARSEFYASALQNGWMERNEVRAKENLNRDPRLDGFTAQTNLASVEDVLSGKAASRGSGKAGGGDSPAPQRARGDTIVVNQPAPQETRVDVRIPDRVEQRIKQEVVLPDLQRVVDEVKAVVAAVDARGARTDQAVLDLSASVMVLARAVKQPRKAVFDEAGNPIGTEAVESLH